MCLWQCYMGILYYWWEILQAARNWIRVSHRMSILGPCIHQAPHEVEVWKNTISIDFGFHGSPTGLHLTKLVMQVILINQNGGCSWNGKWQVQWICFCTLDLVHQPSCGSKFATQCERFNSNLLELHTFPAYFKSIKCMMKIVLWMSPGWRRKCL